MFKYELGVGIRTGVILSQAGEFGFVILALGQKNTIQHRLKVGNSWVAA